MSADFLNKVEDLRKRFIAEIGQSEFSEAENIKVKYLGRNGYLTALLKQLGSLSNDQKPAAGKTINTLKVFINKQINELKNSNVVKEEEDFTLPGRNVKSGAIHPVTRMIYEISDFFTSLGFSIAKGPEIETDFNNFTALNIPETHPARDMHDTFYFDAGNLLRTHTSPVQVRVMKSGKPPFRIICPGKVYRRDSDITHSPMFHQIEGLYVDEGVNFGHLKAILEAFARNIFDESSKVRLRPSFFPFTEPSAEVDISCVMCKGKGCRTCSGSGWLEILGAGMVDPAVLEQVGIDGEKYSGYAFGMGVERIAMLKYKINDIRLYYENHADFLRQFS